MDSVFENDRETGLTVEELSELVIGYAQENERLEARIKHLQTQVDIFLRSIAIHRKYNLTVRAADVAIKNFLSDPAVAPHLDVGTITGAMFGDLFLRSFGGDGNDE